MQLETAFRHLLRADPTVNGYVAGKVFKWRLEEQLEGSGGRAVVLHRDPGWATPDEVKTTSFPVLVVDCYADPTRELGGVIDQLDAEDKAFALYRAVDPLIHTIRGEYIGRFGSDPGLFVVTAGRWGEPTLTTHNDLHGGEERLGDVVYVRCRYRLQTA